MSTIITLILILLAGFAAIRIYSGSKKQASGKYAEDGPAAPAGAAPFSSPFSSKNKLDKALSKVMSQISDAAIHRLPPTPHEFSGRLEDMKLIMDQRKSRPVLIAIHGHRGIGKTALALKLIQKVFFQHREGQFYFDFKTGTPEARTAIDFMAHVISAYHPTTKLPSDKLQLAKMYRTVLKDQNAILFLDNVSGAKQLKPLVPPKNCFLVATSISIFSIPNLISKEIQALEKEEAQEVLLSICSRIGFSNIELAKLCKNIPFALDLAARYLKTRIDVEPGEFIRNFNNEIGRIGQRDDLGVGRAMEAVFNTIYESLPGNVTLVLRKLAVFPSGFESKAETFVCEDSDNVLEILVMMGLVQFDPVGERYTLHDLVREYLLGLLGEGEKGMASMRLAAFYLTVVVTANESLAQGGTGQVRGLLTFDLEWDNIRAGGEWAASRINFDDDACRVCSAYTEAAVNLLRYRKPAKMIVQWLESGLKAAKKLGDTEAEKNHLLNLGEELIQMDQSDLALQHLSRAKELGLEMGDAEGEKTALRLMGLASLKCDNAEQAIEFFQQELERIRLGDENRGEEVTLENLGKCCQKTGDYEGAIKYYSAGLALVQRSKNSEAQGRLLGCLGDCYLATQKHKAALDFFDQGLALARKAGSQEDQGKILSQLGTTHIFLKNYDKASSSFQQALNLAQKSSNIELEGEVTWNMSRTLKLKGDRKGAIAQAKKALKIFGLLKHPAMNQVQEQLKIWVMSEENEVL